MWDMSCANDPAAADVRLAHMKLLDTKFRANKLRYVFQCALAGAAMLVILAILTTISNAAVIAALGASVFLVFAVPHARSCRARFLIGGYVAGAAAGSLCYWLRCVSPLPERLGLIPELPGVVFGAAAVGLATFVMVITDSEHPPAAGLALGFALLDEWRWVTLVAVMGGIVGLCLIKILLRRVLRDLL